MSNEKQPMPLTEGHSISAGVAPKPGIPKPPVKPVGQGTTQVTNSSKK